MAMVEKGRGQGASLPTTASIIIVAHEILLNGLKSIVARLLLAALSL